MTNLKVKPEINFFGTDSSEVMRITRDKIQVSPDVSADEAAQAVLTALESHIKHLVASAVAAEREACEEIARKELDNTFLLTTLPPKSGAAWNIAAAIRARGEA